MSDLVADTLKSMGAAGAAITVLMTTIGGLVTAVVYQYKQGNKVYGYRLAERDTLNKALTDSSAAIAAFTKIGEERNEITSDLSDVIVRLTASLDHLKIAIDDIKDQVKEQNKVLGSMAEAVRVLNGIATDTRNWIQALPRRSR